MILVAALVLASPFADSFAWAPSSPGKAIGAKSTNASQSNAAISIARTRGAIAVANKWTGARLSLAQTLFTIVLKGGRTLTSSNMQVGKPMGGVLMTHFAPTKQPDYAYGVTEAIPFTDKQTHLTVTWRSTLTNNSNYARFEVTLKPTVQDVAIDSVRLLDFTARNAYVAGTVPGSPVVAGDFFAGLEHPMSLSLVEGGHVTCSMRRIIPLRKGTSATYSAVVGVAPSGQMRRAFLNYVESERAHPYRPFLHYNNWLDTAYGRPFTQTECIDRIDKFGEQMVKQRGVKMDSFLFDDGWDNTNSVWEFHSGFPNAFLPLRDAAAKYGAGVGVWLSPWGGYATARNQRLAYGKAHGMEVDTQGYALSGPNYYKRFHEVTMDFVTRQGIDMFKFDGTGSPDKTTPGSQFDSDFDAAISLIGDLRKARRDLFINLTTGTWPSPFWLRYADSTWRGGADSSYAGVGTKRQQWITYRDGDTYHGVVQRGPLYPINSLMVHGLIYASHSGELRSDPGNDFADEVHSYFGSGTQLQEMYITPDLLSEKNWDDLAEAAKWSRANADVLKDTHWVGGDPSKLDVYGWASWSPRKSILVLRNPSDKPQAFSVDIGAVLELPAGSATSYIGHSPWRGENEMSMFQAGRSQVIDLKPFEVRTFELAPSNPNSAGAAPFAGYRLATAQPFQAQANMTPQRVACVGASIVEGVGTSDHATKSYPAQLQRMLGSNYVVGNFGHSGATLTRGTDLPYTSTAEYQKALKFNPDVVVIMLGTNDATKARWPKVKNEYVPQYKEMIESFRALPSHPKVFACLPPANYEERRQNIEEGVIPLVNQLARETAVHTIDLYSPLVNRPELFPDKLHPNDEGAALIAQAVAEGIEDPALRKKAWRVVSVDSEEPGEGPAKAAVDGDTYTYWHTNYSSKETRPPHEIVVDMGSAIDVAGFRYLPRQDGGVNGRVKRFEVYLSLDGQNWGSPALAGEIKDIVGWTSWSLPALVSARYFKFRALTEQHGGPWTSVGELDVRRAIHP